MVAWAINELVLGANLAVFIYLAGRYSRTSCTGSATSNKALGWHIEGVKRFITNGDTDDLFENVLHMVLARPRRVRHQGPEPVCLPPRRFSSRTCCHG